MTLPVPQNYRIREKDRYVDFEVKLYGRMVQARIAIEALEARYPQFRGRPLEEMKDRSIVTRWVKARLDAGEPERITLTFSRTDVVS